MMREIALLGFLRAGEEDKIKSFIGLDSSLCKVLQVVNFLTAVTGIESFSCISCR